MEPILVLGATGFTGRLVIEALERRGRTFVAAGRDPRKLEVLAARLGKIVDVRVADVSKPETLDGLFDGVGAVINTVGPFEHFGLTVVRAAIAQSTHYVDTTGEQAFHKQVYLKCHQEAVDAEVTVMPAQAFEFAFSQCGAAILNQRCGPIFSTSAYHDARDFRPSVGTMRSIAALIGAKPECCIARELAPVPTAWAPERLRLPGESGDLFAVAIPGGDSISLPGDIESLRDASTHILLPRGSARVLAVVMRLQERFGSRLPANFLHRLDEAISQRWSDPSTEAREQSTWSVHVRAGSVSGLHSCKMSGRDVYRTSGETAALAATLLADGKATAPGVRTTGGALDAEAFLDDLKSVGVSWELR